MDREGELSGISGKDPSELSHTIFSPQNAITIYTILAILLNMKRTLGIEAMMEYMDKYITVIDEHNPEFKFAVWRALSYISMEKLYKNILSKS